MDQGAAVTFQNIGRLDPFAGCRPIGFVTDHALRKQPCDGLVHSSVSGLGHRAHVETRIEQMQDSVFNPSYVLVYRQPVISGIAVCRRISMGRGEAREVPRRIHKCIEGVRFSGAGLSAFRAIHRLPCLMTVQRITRAIEADVVGEHNR